MKLQIGRFGLNLASGEVQSADSSGSKVSITGRTAYSNLEQSLALRQQILGYVDNSDETFVPVLWDEYPAFNGYYRVTGANVDGKRGLASLGKVEFSVDLERVQGFAAPLVEDIIMGAVRPSALGITGIRWVGIPTAAKSFVEYADGTPTGFGDPSATRVGENGSVGIYRGIHDSCIGQFYIPAENYYDGAATLEINDRVVTGRQVPNEPTAWVLSNDLMQARIAADTFELQIRKWNGTAWSSWHTAAIMSSLDLPFPEWQNLVVPHTITVLRNSPEMVVIRLVTKLGTLTGEPLTVDISLRRGARTFAVQYHSTRERLIQVRMSDFAGATARTGGWNKQLSAGANGELLVFGSPREVLYGGGGGVGNFGPATGADRVLVAAWAFTLGITTTPEDTDTFAGADVALKEYFWAGVEKQTVVAQ